MSVYADTSFFVSLYVPDQHSLEAERRMAARPVVWLTPLHHAEWTHAIAEHVFQRKISAAEANKVHLDMEHDRAAGLWAETGMPELAWESCADLARRHCARLGVRTLDTLHVASALQLKAERFWTFDDRQTKLAHAVGLKIA